MRVKSKTTLVGGALALVFATACCWLPILLLSIGAGTGLIALAEGAQGYSNLLMGGGVILILIGSLQVYKKSPKKTSIEIIPYSTITCPLCRHSKKEKMPTDACQYFYECENCNKILKPNEGDCCVYCSYGDVDCPPIQKGADCC